MITKLILSSLFAVLFSSGLIYKSDNVTTNKIANEDQATEHVMKAIIFEGEILPHINLPVVEITAELNTDRMVHAEIIDGEVVPVINLQEVVITPNSGLNSI